MRTTNPAQVVLFPHEPWGMGVQGGLPPHQPDSATSRNAAESVLPRLAKRQKLYMATLRSIGPASDHMMHAATGLPLSSMCSIRNSLMKFEPPLVRDSGKQVLSPFNKWVTCWEVNPNGNAARIQRETE